ncbi:hypothetical protein AB7942_10685 [Neobacillus sp. BF23-41]|uniref:hypothetical protein n=1 Tax=Neobacillus sp. BF23-41 TaxID=3240280 RepID=UPI0034E42065
MFQLLLKHPYYKRTPKKGKTVMLASSESEILAFIAVADEVRGNSKSDIQKLHSLGIHIC